MVMATIALMADNDGGSFFGFLGVAFALVFASKPFEKTQKFRHKK